VEFAKKLYQAIESYHIKCSMCLPQKGKLNSKEIDESITTGIGVVFICSSKSVQNRDCVIHLQHAKQQQKGIFPLWHEKITFNEVMESLLFRRQLVDFSDKTKFSESASLLCNGIQRLFQTGKLDNEDESGSKEEHVQQHQLSSENVKSSNSIFICFEAQDSPEAETLSKHLISKGLSVTLATYQNNSTNILKSGVFIVILSTKSATSSRVRDQLALAENHQKLLISLFLKENLVLDPAMQYTLARAPSFFHSDPHCLDQLAFILHMKIEMNQLTTTASKKKVQLDEIEMKLEQKVQQKKKIRRAYVVE